MAKKKDTSKRKSSAPKEDPKKRKSSAPKEGPKQQKRHKATTTASLPASRATKSKEAEKDSLVSLQLPSSGDGNKDEEWVKDSGKEEKTEKETNPEHKEEEEPIEAKEGATDAKEGTIAASIGAESTKTTPIGQPIVAPKEAVYTETVKKTVTVEKPLSKKAKQSTYVKLLVSNFVVSPRFYRQL